MDDPKTIESSGAFGIPKWIMKKGMRYEVDDFIVSPPSNEDGGFMRLRFGRCPSPRHHLASHDQAEADLGMTVEVHESRSVISGLGGIGSKGGVESSPNPGTATITFGPGVLSSEVTPPTTPSSPSESLLGSAQSSPQHLLPTSLPDLTVALKNEAPSKSESNLRAADDTSLLSMSSAGSVIASTLRKISATKPPIQELLNEGEYDDRLEESVKQLDLSVTPDISPDPTPKNSPILRRKVPSIVMENPNKSLKPHSYFCTKPFQPQNTQGSEGGGTSAQEGVIGGSGLSSSTAGLSSSTATGTMLMDEGAKSAQTLEAAGNFMGKRRQRPKPSTLREMNFWAPTSM